MNALKVAALTALLAALCYGQGEPENGVIRNAIRYMTNSSSVGRLAGESCQHEGYRCKSCNSRQLCFPHETGFDVIDIDEECPDEHTCNLATGECIKEEDAPPSYCTIGSEFDCKVAGVFPSPFDCNLFYTCMVSENGKLEPYVHICPPGTTYDIEKYDCSGPDTCEKPLVQECEGQAEITIGATINKSIYYACEGGVPIFYKCLGGDSYTFDIKTGACKKDSTYRRSENQLTIDELLNRSNNNLVSGADKDAWRNKFTSGDNIN